MQFNLETEHDNKMSFLDVNVIREQGKFTTNVYQKPTFNGGYTHFDSFSPINYKIGMVYTLVNRCFRVCSIWSIFYSQFALLRKMFQKNGYPGASLIDVLRCC